jgi:hypothetical protein
VYQAEKSIFDVTLSSTGQMAAESRTSLYYHKGRLYLADAIDDPARGDKDMTTLSRFDQTIAFRPMASSIDKGIASLEHRGRTIKRANNL